MKPLKARQVEKQEVKIDRKKKGETIIQSRIEKEITNNKKPTVIPKVDVRSPTKDELKNKLLELARKFNRSNKLTATEILGNVVPSTSHTHESEKNKKSDSATESETDSSFEKMDRMSDWRNSNGSYDQSFDDDDSKTSKGDKDDKKADDKVNGKDDGKDDDKENDSKNSEIIKEIGSDNPIINDPIDDIDDRDLYGKDWPEEKMVKLMNKVYCKESEYRQTRSMCCQASHVVRRLITGVFKPSGYLNATFTGQASRAHKQGKPASVKSLNDTAKNEIIDYAISLAKAKKWVTPKGVPQDKEYLAKVMSQRIGELKRAHELNKNAKS